MGEEAKQKKLEELVSVLLYFDGHGLTITQRQSGKRIDEEVLNLPADVFSRPKAPAGTWASGIRIVNPVDVSLIVLSLAEGLSNTT